MSSNCTLEETNVRERNLLSHIANMILAANENALVIGGLTAPGQQAYLIFVTNAVNAVRVKILAECKKTPEEPEKYCFWQFCRKFTHFPSVKFS